MNKGAEMYYHLNDAVSAVGRANAVFADLDGIKWSYKEDGEMRDAMTNAHRALINAQNLLAKRIGMEVPENERRDD